MRKFIAIFYFQGWNEISLGVSIDIKRPNLEIHIPFGFIKIGWMIFANEKEWNFWKDTQRGFTSNEKIKQKNKEAIKIN